jgi:CheY-like chemotaxis protein
MASGADQPRLILVVDDSPGDVGLIIEALRDSPRSPCIRVVADGEASLAYLQQAGIAADQPRPDLVLLDLHLPRRDGRAVLATIKADPRLRAIPVVIFSSSADPHDIQTSYALQANCYITKPVELDAFLAVVRAIDAFWLTVVSLPPAAP